MVGMRAKEREEVIFIFDSTCFRNDDAVEIEHYGLSHDHLHTFFLRSSDTRQHINFEAEDLQRSGW